MPARRFLRRTLFAILFVSMAGCSQKPAEEARQNRRLVDAILTAVTTRNQKELKRDAVLWNKRLADGLLEAASHRAVSDSIAKASNGDWAGAEDDLYRFRDSEPFPE